MAGTIFGIPFDEELFMQMWNEAPDPYLTAMIESGAVVMDLCIDQPASDFRKRAPHDRGPHIRIPLRKLTSLFENVEKIM